MGVAVVSSCDSAKILEASEHTLDGVAVAVQVGREAVLPASVGLRWNVRSGPLALDLAADGVAVVALVAVQDHGWGHLVEQGVGAAVQSATWPPVNRKAKGRQKRSLSAWTFVVRPPRERPIAWVSSPLYRLRRSDAP